MDNLLIHNFNTTQTFLEQESGELVELKETALKKPPVNDKLYNFSLKGKTVQNGEPTHINPVPILSVPSNFDITACGENLFDFNATANLTVTKISNGFNIQGSSSWKSGSLDYLNLPSGEYRIAFNIQQKAVVGTVALSIRKKGSDSPTYRDVATAQAESRLSDTFTIPPGEGGIRLYLYSNYTGVAKETNCDFTNIQITPVSQTNTNYSPYIGSTTPITLRDTNGGLHELCSLPDGTADEVDFESGKIIKRTAFKVFDGTENWTFSGNSVYTRVLTGRLGGESTRANMRCNYFVVTNETTPSQGTCRGSDNEGINDYFQITNSFTPETIKAFCLAKYTEGNPLMVLYRLETPQVIDLHPDELEKLNSIKSVQYHTNIFTSARVQPTMSFLARKLGNKAKELQNFYLSNGEQLFLSNYEPLEIYL